MILQTIYTEISSACFFWMRFSANQNHSWYLKEVFGISEYSQKLLMVLFIRTWYHISITKIAPIFFFWRCGATSAHTCHDNWVVKTKCLNHHLYRHIFSSYWYRSVSFYCMWIVEMYFDFSYKITNVSKKSEPIFPTYLPFPVLCRTMLFI